MTDMTEPQDVIYAVVHEEGGKAVPRTASSSGRWAFKGLNPAAQRAHHDRQTGDPFRPRKVRVARYRFDGWAT